MFQNFRHSVRSMSHAVAIARTLERMERGRLQSAALARRSIASRLKVGVGTFENILRERVKSVDAALRDKLQALLIHELENEIDRLTHELEIARQTGLRLDSHAFTEVETHLAAARAILGGAAKG